MLQQPEPEDYVVATGEQHSVRDFAVLAGRLLGMNIEWRGSGVEEVGMDHNSGRVVVRVDPREVQIDKLPRRHLARIHGALQLFDRFLHYVEVGE